MHTTFRIFVVRLLQLTTITPMKQIILMAAIGCLFVLSACQGGAQKETAENEEVLNVPECVVTTPLQAASKPLYVRTSLDCVQTKAFLTILKSFIGQQSFFIVPLLLEYEFHGLRVERLHGG